MNTVTKNSRFLIIVVLLSTLALGQLVYADGPGGTATGIPQWVCDRQQYETTYVFEPMADTVQPPKIAIKPPQWARDRQQYETTYIFEPR